MGSRKRRYHSSASISPPSIDYLSPDERVRVETCRDSRTELRRPPFLASRHPESRYSSRTPSLIRKFPVPPATFPFVAGRHCEFSDGQTSLNAFMRGAEVSGARHRLICNQIPDTLKFCNLVGPTSSRIAAGDPAAPKLSASRGQIPLCCYFSPCFRPAINVQRKRRSSGRDGGVTRVAVVLSRVWFATVCFEGWRTGGGNFVSCDSTNRRNFERFASDISRYF